MGTYPMWLAAEGLLVPKLNCVENYTEVQVAWSGRPFKLMC